MQQMDVPVGQRDQAKNKLRNTVRHTLVQKINGENWPIQLKYSDWSVIFGLHETFVSEGKVFAPTEG